MVTGVSIGTARLGSTSATVGAEVAKRDGVSAIRAVLSGPFNFLDTSNNYSAGLSEQLIGQAIRDGGGAPEGFVLATKVDGAYGVFDGQRVRRSLEESLKRLGVSTLALLYLHDPHDYMTFADAMKPSGPVCALQSLKDDGVVENIGIAMGPLAETAQYLRTGLFDVVLTHNRYSLLDRSAEPVINEAHAANLGVVNAAPFGGGILAKGARAVGRYAYGEGSQAQVRAAAEMQAACERAHIPLAAAALQFSTRDLRIDATIVGLSRPERVAAIRNLLDLTVPASLWVELEALTPPPTEWMT